MADLVNLTLHFRCLQIKKQHPDERNTYAFSTRKFPLTPFSNNESVVMDKRRRPAAVDLCGSPVSRRCSPLKRCGGNKFSRFVWSSRELVLEARKSRPLSGYGGRRGDSRGGLFRQVLRQVFYGEIWVARKGWACCLRKEKICRPPFLLPRSTATS